jgi:hypothetical protein
LSNKSLNYKNKSEIYIPENSSNNRQNEYINYHISLIIPPKLTKNGAFS